jgi:hypothetical protein
MSAGQIGLKQPSDLWLLESLEQFSVEGADVAVVGTMEPWVESWCIAFGAKSVTTIEYNNLTIDHPGITTVTAARFAELQSEAALDPITEDGSAKLQATNSSPRLLFDVVISITSVDHDGLGRSIWLHGFGQVQLCTTLVCSPLFHLPFADTVIRSHPTGIYRLSEISR